jgi:hypothetical protein
MRSSSLAEFARAKGLAKAQRYIPLKDLVHIEFS